MGIDLQKASFGKRIIAFIFDFICVITIAVGLMIPFSAAVGYDDYSEKFETITEKYLTESLVKHNISQLSSDEISKLTKEEKDAYANSYKTAIKDAPPCFAKCEIFSLSFLPLKKLYTLVCL